MSRERELVFALTEVLGECGEPYTVAAAMMAEALGTVDELRREMEELVDDLLTLARLEGHSPPEEDVAAARRDLLRLGRLRERLQLDVLFSAEIRERCGRHAVPLLAMRLVQVWNEAESASEWLAGSERLRICVDALLASRAAPSS